MSHSSASMQVPLHFVLYKHPFGGAPFIRQLTAFGPAPMKHPAFLYTL